MKLRLQSILCALMGVLLTPVLALAQDEVKINARLSGYKTDVIVDDASAALTWLVCIVLAGICLGVLFKNAKRTHLD